MSDSENTGFKRRKKENPSEESKFDFKMQILFYVILVLKILQYSLLEMPRAYKDLERMQFSNRNIMVIIAALIISKILILISIGYLIIEMVKNIVKILLNDSAIKQEVRDFIQEIR